MSQTTDAEYGYKWSIIILIAVQFAILWALAQFWIHKMLKRRKQLNLKLFIVGVLGIVIANNLIYFLVKGIAIKFFDPRFEIINGFVLLLSTVEGFLKGILIISMLFSLHFFKRWRTENEENQRLKQNELELENRALKSQLNPHFLFNNLNTLSVLITQDQYIANEFLKEMSDMYRYILKTTDVEIVPLEDELKFAQNYGNLLKKRFGKDFNFNVEINNLNFVLPPISLHLLLENVVKHNRIDADYPMNLLIKQSGNTLICKNTVNLKNMVDSTEKGLKILADQYRYLSNKEINVQNENGLFIVTLPLLTVK